MDSLNTLVLSGALERDPSTSFQDDGQQLTRFTLRVEEQGKAGAVFKLWVAVECYGKTAERAAALGAGAVVGVEGKLKWRSTTDKHGEKKGSLCMLARQVSVLVPAASEVRTP
jgi:single-stranded DNA-binding protein